MNLRLGVNIRPPKLGPRGPSTPPKLESSGRSQSDSRRKEAPRLGRRRSRSRPQSFVDIEWLIPDQFNLILHAQIRYHCGLGFFSDDGKLRCLARNDSSENSKVLLCAQQHGQLVFVRITLKAPHGGVPVFLSEHSRRNEAYSQPSALVFGRRQGCPRRTTVLA